MLFKNKLIIGVLFLSISNAVVVHAQETPPQLSPFDFEDFTADGSSSPSKKATTPPAKQTTTPASRQGDDVAAGVSSDTDGSRVSARGKKESLSSDELSTNNEGKENIASPAGDLPGTGSSLLIVASLSVAAAYCMRKLRKTI